MMNTQTACQFSERLLNACLRAKRVVAFTGAGISAESGVPTFRGDAGIWTKFKPEELASFDAFMRNPEMVWAWYDHRRHVTESVHPNAGHYALVDLERRFAKFAVITQNIDNLHQRAGSKTVFELHGNIERNYCVSCRKPFLGETMREGTIPRCSYCGGLVRPDVVWFGELLPADQWEAAEVAARRADVFLSIGTSGVVFPAASLPTIAKREGSLLIEINAEPTPLTDSADEFLMGKSGDVLPRLVEALNERGLTG